MAAGGHQLSRLGALFVSRSGGGYVEHAVVSLTDDRKLP